MNRQELVKTIYDNMTALVQCGLDDLSVRNRNFTANLGANMMSNDINVKVVVEMLPLRIEVRLVGRESGDEQTLFTVEMGPGDNLYQLRH